MATVLYYYTGTGNSLWTAQQVAAHIGDARLVPMAQAADARDAREADVVGLVFPVHMWGVPALVMRFIEGLSVNPKAYCFAVAVNAGQVSRTLIQLKGLLKTRGIELAAGFDIVLPSNYIPWGGPGPAEKLEVLHRAAERKIRDFAPLVAQRKAGPIERGPLWQRILFTALYKMTFGQVPKMDGKFWVDESCNACGMCARVCPVANITMETGRPRWHHRCEQCLACIQWCPHESIEYGKKTPAYERYHHPAIKLKDMLAR